MVTGGVGTDPVASYRVGSGVMSMGMVGADHSLTELTRVVGREGVEFGVEKLRDGRTGESVGRGSGVPRCSESWVKRRG